MKENNEQNLFVNEEFGKLRTLTINGEMWFVAKDVCSSLGYKWVSDALKKHVHFQDRHKAWVVVDDLGTQQEVNVINQSGLFSLVMRSDLPGAKKYQHWVTSEVLPSIHKYGAYMTPSAIAEYLQSPDGAILLIKTLHNEQVARREVEKRYSEAQEFIEESRPKIEFADHVSELEDTISLGTLAKLLKQNGVEIGRNRLCALMREEGFLLDQTGSYNMPSQRALKADLLVVEETIIREEGKRPHLNAVTRVTPKGQIYFINRYKAD